MNEIVLKVVERRKELGMSQKELANKLNIAPQYWGQIELGRVSPSVDTCIAALKAVGLNMCYSEDEVNSSSKVDSLTNEDRR